MTWSILHDVCDHQNSDAIIDRARSNSDEALLVDDHGFTPLHIACGGASGAVQSPEVLSALINAHPHAILEKDFHGDTPLHIALECTNSAVNVVSLLVGSSPTVASIANREGLMPIHTACRYCPENEEIVGMLVDAYPFALRTRIKMGEPVPRKRPQGLSTKKELDHVIIDASAKSGVCSADLRFSERQSSEVRDGSYPLHIAVANGASLPVVEILIKEAPDVLLLTNKFGMTPLHVALECKNESSDEMVELLLFSNDKAASMADSKSKRLPLHVACANGCSVRTAKALLKANAVAILAEDEDGKTPLETAESSGKCEDDVLHLLELSAAANA